MPAPRRPVFLAPATYRRKRLRDAARLLPALGAALLLVPLLWPVPDGIGNAAALLYLFAVWAALIAAAFALARVLGREEAGRDSGPDSGDEP